LVDPGSSLAVPVRRELAQSASRDHPARLWH
jgi:hypothetical protein